MWLSLFAALRNPADTRLVAGPQPIWQISTMPSPAIVLDLVYTYAITHQVAKDKQRKLQEIQQVPSPLHGPHPNATRCSFGRLWLQGGRCHTSHILHVAPTPKVPQSRNITSPTLVESGEWRVVSLLLQFTSVEVLVAAMIP